jgi:site-specific DNA-methyltransferase (adenine-specific)
MISETLFSSKSTEWRTPLDLFLKLDEEFGFELDAAATEENSLCHMHYSEEDDALSDDNPWHPFNTVFINPPYGRGIGAWCEKAWKETQKGATVVMLMPARTDTIWFHEWVYGRAEIRFLKGRLKFLDEQGNKLNAAPFPSMVVVYKPPHMRSL